MHLTGSFLKWPKAADALVRVRGLYSIWGHFYNPILFDTVRLSGSHFKRVKKHDDYLPCILLTLHICSGENIQIYLCDTSYTRQSIFGIRRQRRPRGSNPVIIHISLKRSNRLINRLRAKKTNVFREGLSAIAKNIYLNIYFSYSMHLIYNLCICSKMA